MYCTIYWNKLVLGAILASISLSFPCIFFCHNLNIMRQVGDSGEFPAGLKALWWIRNKAIFGGTLRPPIYISIISWITIFHSIVSITFISFYFSYCYFIRTYIWFVILQLHFELLQQSLFPWHKQLLLHCFISSCDNWLLVFFNRLIIMVLSLLRPLLLFVAGCCGDDDDAAAAAGLIG